MGADYYDVLGVSKSATDDDLKKGMFLFLLCGIPSAAC